MKASELKAEVVKAILQLIAVAVGVYLGFSYNEQSARRERLRQAYADFAAAEAVLFQEERSEAFAFDRAPLTFPNPDRPFEPTSAMLSAIGKLEEARARIRVLERRKYRIAKLNMIVGIAYGPTRAPGKAFSGIGSVMVTVPQPTPIDRIEMAGGARRHILEELLSDIAEEGY
jgi:hypothetical protein